MHACPKWAAGLILIIGILFLVADYKDISSWWKVSWWTALFIICGLASLLKSK